MHSDSVYTDQLGREVRLPATPQRIISVVPSQTELLFDLGLKDRIVGITKFCIHPAADVQSVTKIGGTKQLNIELIKSLNPDLIIANKEENDRSQLEELMALFPVWISDISTVDEAVDMINSIGQITGKQPEATQVIDTITESFHSIKPLSRPLSIAYFIWRKPYMVAGHGTFINHLLTRCGFKNALQQERYPEIEVENLVKLKPDVVFLSSEPYPFRQKHIDELKAVLPQAGIYLVDGELFSWYGSRLQYSAAYFRKLLQKLVNQP